MDAINLPEETRIEPFVPVAYYDKHMDCIRVLTHDRSVTEHRIDGIFTLHECNHRGPLDPVYVGFTIKGVHKLFKQIGLDIDGVYKLADLITAVVQHCPGAVAETLRLIFHTNPLAGDLHIDLKKAA